MKTFHDTPMAESAQDEVELIQAHFDRIISAMLAADTSDLNADQKARRDLHIERLAAYRDAGRFPINTRHPRERMPYFRDDFGTLCAVGHLMWETGATEIVDNIVAERNNAYVPELADEPGLLEWLEAEGLTVDEARCTQPSYGPGWPGRPPRPFPGEDQGQIMARVTGTAKDAKKDIANAPVSTDSNGDSVKRYYDTISKGLADKLEVSSTAGKSAWIKNENTQLARFVRNPIRILRSPVNAASLTIAPPTWGTPESGHSKIAGDAMMEAAKAADKAFGAVLKALDKAIKPWRDGKVYLTDTELFTLEAAVASFNAAKKTFTKATESYEAMRKLDMPRPGPGPVRTATGS